MLGQPHLFIRHQVLLRLGAEIASTQNLHGAVGVLLLAALVIVLVLVILRRDRDLGGACDVRRGRQRSEARAGKGRQPRESAWWSREDSNYQTGL